MSIPRNTTITCPKCGKQFQATTFDSLNTDFAPDVAESVISGKRFDCKCPSCGAVSHLCYDFLYHDIKHNAMIWLVGRENTEANEKINEIRSVPTPGIKTTRIVRDVSSLREKAACLEAGRDDRIIELCKVFLEIELMNQRPDLRVKRSFYSYEGGTETVYLYDENNRELHTELDDRIYFVVSEMFEQLLGGMEETPYQIIDHEWASEVFGKLHESPPDLDPDSVAEKYQATKANPAGRSSALTCPDCGMELPEGSDFCQYCGARLAPKSPETPHTVSASDTVNTSPDNRDSKVPDVPKNNGAKHSFIKFLIYFGFCAAYGLCITTLSYAGVRGALVTVLIAAAALYGARKSAEAYDKRVASANEAAESSAAVSKTIMEPKEAAVSASEKEEIIAAPADNTFQISLSQLPPSPEQESIHLDLREKGLSPTLRRAFLLLEDGDWEKADDYLERVLDEDPENAFAYFGKLLQSHRIKSAQDLLTGSSIPSDDRNLQKALRFSEDADLTGLLEQLSSDAPSKQAPSSEGKHHKVSLPKKQKSDKVKTRKKLKPLTIVLLSAAGLLLIACGTYFGTYFAAKSKAYQGEYEKAQRLLIVPALTEKMDPELGEYIKNGIAYEDALSDLKNGDSSGYRIISALAKDKFSPAEQYLEEAKSTAYDIAVGYYHAGQTLKATQTFRDLGDYKRSVDYITLFNKASVAKIKELVGFEDADEILLDDLADQFLEGTWKTSNGNYYFYVEKQDDGGYQSNSNLPSNTTDNSYYDIKNGVYFLYSQEVPYYKIDSGNYEKVNVFRFSIIDADTITIYCFKDGSTYTLYRQ